MTKVFEKVTVESLAGGAAIERANIELEKALENILDVRTGTKQAREVNLKIKMWPSEDRTMGAVVIQATSKLAPISEHMAQVYIGRSEDGTAEASEVVTPELPFGNNITHIKEGTNDA